MISKIDLSKGYHQVPMKEKDICKMALLSHRGKFEFVTLPFGVRNAPAIFQALMTKLFSSCKKFCSPYMDDLVIYSDTWEEHIVHVKEVLAKLKGAGLTANPAKCVWGAQTMEFLGHQVGNGFMTIPAKRAEALTNYTRPTTKKGLRSFLGAISFYRRYVEKLASQIAVLSPSTSKLAPSKVLWTTEMETAFHNICEFNSNTCILTIPLPEDMMSVVSDASGLGIGGVLQVKRGDDWEAAVLFSRQIRGAKQRYLATKLEALTLVETIKHFGYYLWGKCFTAFTDHKPLCQLMISDQLNGRLRRMAMKLQHCLVTVEYLQGAENGLADALSREERQRIWETVVRTDASLVTGDVGECPHEVSLSGKTEMRSTQAEDGRMEQ